MSSSTRSLQLIALATLCGGIFIGSYFRLFGSEMDARAESFISTDSEIAQRLRQEKVEAFYKWNVRHTDDESLLCVVRAFDKDPNWAGQGMKLTILNPSGKPIYEEYFERLMRVYETTALRNLSSQLVLEVIYGGTGTYHLRMLDYRNGKIVKVLDGEHGLFNANAEVRPQFRSGIFPAKEPFQIMLTEGVGLASPAQKDTRVYRYKSGAYQFAGKFRQQKLDDYMERLLKESQQR
jgi:hypothetical protein